MKNMHMREKVQHKLNSMASILLDDIIVPGQIEQQGNETVMGSYYDEQGNKYTFTLSLVVTPEEKEAEEPTLGVPEQIALILEKIGAIETDIGNLKQYHLNDDQQNVDEPNAENNSDN